MAVKKIIEKEVRYITDRGVVVEGTIGGIVQKKFKRTRRK